MPATEGGRGGGFAPAHRRNLNAARSNNQALSEVIAAALQRHADSVNAAGSRPSLPTQEGKVGADLHLRKATTLTLRLAITIMNQHLTDILRWIMNL
jgi:hypothetical protein